MGDDETWFAADVPFNRLEHHLCSNRLFCCLKPIFCSPFLLVILFLVNSPLFGKIPALPGRPSPWQGHRASKAAGRQLREDRVFSLHAWRWGTQSGTIGKAGLSDHELVDLGL